MQQQSICLMAIDGWEFMESAFDELPHAVRIRLRNSPYNLCTACVIDYARKDYALGEGNWYSDIPIKHYFTAIDLFEQQIREGEGNE